MCDAAFIEFAGIVIFGTGDVLLVNAAGGKLCGQAFEQIAEFIEGFVFPNLFERRRFEELRVVLNDHKLVVGFSFFEVGYFGELSVRAVSLPSKSIRI